MGFSCHVVGYFQKTVILNWRGLSSGASNEKKISFLAFSAQVLQ